MREERNNKIESRDKEMRERKWERTCPRTGRERENIGKQKQK